MSAAPAPAVRSRLEKARALLGGGRVEAAERALTELGREHPEASEVWLLLASIHGPRGRYEEVVDCCHRVLAAEPQHPGAHSLLGSALVWLGQREAAVEHLSTARALAPGDPDIQINLGNALYAIGSVEEALDCFRAVLAARPGHPLASFGQGNCCLALGRWNEAITNFRHACRAMPGDYHAHMSLGKAYVNIGELDEASACFRRAVQLDANPSVALCELASATQLQGDLEQALGYIEQSLERQPDNAHARAERAGILYKLGRAGEAHALIRALVDEGQRIPHLVSVWGHLCHQFNECREVMALGESLLDESHVNRATAVTLHYMLGRLYDRAGEYDTAFGHYRQANTIIPAEFKRPVFGSMIDSLMAAYPGGGHARLRRSTCRDRRPVFIVGMPRSGTSLVEQILASHAAVFGAGELNDMKRIAKAAFRGKEAELPAYLQSLDRHELDVLARDYLNTIDELGGNAMRVTDKMPANFLWLGLIWQLFPQARVIHCRRDPRDTCLSIYFQQFTKGHAYASDLGDLAFYYRQYERLMAHWNRVLEIPILEVNYADLVDDMEAHARELVRFLDLEWDDRCLKFHASGRVTATASWDQVRQPVHAKSVARWRHYRRHLGPLLAEFGADDYPLEGSGRRNGR